MTKIKVDNKSTKRLFSKRSLSRLVGVQILYQHSYNSNDRNILEIMDEVIDNYTIDGKEEVKSYRKKVEMNFLRNLVNGSILVLDKLDQEISKHLDKKRKLEEIDDVILQILRLGVFELKFIKDNPYKVTISEYVDITHSFYNKNQIDFVNAILDKIAQNGK